MHPVGYFGGCSAMKIRERKYVPLIVRFDENVKMWSREIEFSDGKIYKIDRVLDVCRAACQIAGGTGNRYTVRIHGKETYLWFEGPRWFVAAISTDMKT